MIDYTLFAVTLAILVIGAIYACTCANISGRDDVEDDGRRDAPPLSNVVRFVRRQGEGRDS